MITTLEPITAEAYWRLAEQGAFQDRRVELIGGEIVTMSPQSTWHTGTIANVQDALEAIFSRRYFWVRNQGTLDLGPLSQPDPDLAVVVGSRRDWMSQNRIPDHAVLVVEVSESTLADDRTRKASLYAASGIGEYWIVNLVDRVLEVRREVVADAGEPFGHRYGSVAVLGVGEVVSPVAMPSGTVAVADLLPN